MAADKIKSTLDAVKIAKSSQDIDKKELVDNLVQLKVNIDKEKNIEKVFLDNNNGWLVMRKFIVLRSGKGEGEGEGVPSAARINLESKSNAAVAYQKFMDAVLNANQGVESSARSFIEGQMTKWSLRELSETELLAHKNETPDPNQHPTAEAISTHFGILYNITTWKDYKETLGKQLREFNFFPILKPYAQST